MRLTRKQRIILLSLTGVTLLLLAALCIVVVVVGDTSTPPTEPQVPSYVHVSTPTPAPISPTPSPTPYRLPLLPMTQERTPTPTPTETPAATPNVTPFAPTAGREGQYNATSKELLAVGTQNGIATAILLLRVTADEVRVIVIPCETMAYVYTLAEGPEIVAVNETEIGDAFLRGGDAGSWNLVWAVKNLTGCLAPAYMQFDLEKLSAVFSVVSNVKGQTITFSAETLDQQLAKTGTERAAVMGEFAYGMYEVVQAVSIWDLPEIQRKVKGGFETSLSTSEMIALARAIENAKSCSVTLLPVTQYGENWYQNAEDVQKIIENLLK